MSGVADRLRRTLRRRCVGYYLSMIGSIALGRPRALLRGTMSAIIWFGIRGAGSLISTAWSHRKLKE
jgi:hypothetical protein